MKFNRVFGVLLEHKPIIGESNVTELESNFISFPKASCENALSILQKFFWVEFQFIK